MEKRLPKEIVFITSQELEDMYPDVSTKEWEYRFVKKHGTVFIIIFIQVNHMMFVHQVMMI
ncbi:hypothetical protein COI63_34935 [Bacillus toyonensis]|nr:hypothetical protein CN594_34455 [Bacillus toyonensis]PEO43191.1 hypothetical protein CN579_33080 [Bacillus toyonensis]PFY28596.1 hypothetical protein COL54_34390 [Bacillus toyonensis]PFY33190.1 hypothetical protein COL55_32480 [Bacillus toyonensis]PFY70825.1 hypothetical protein COL62_25385 [Bacillus toyonensis]